MRTATLLLALCAAITVPLARAQPYTDVQRSSFYVATRDGTRTHRSGRDSRAPPGGPPRALRGGRRALPSELWLGGR